MKKQKSKTPSSITLDKEIDGHSMSYWINGFTQCLTELEHEGLSAEILKINDASNKIVFVIAIGEG